MQVTALTALFTHAGTAIAINMPMTVDAVVIYLGIIYAGCAAVSIADSFAPSEISTRLQIANTKAIFVQDVILRSGKAHPLYERVVKAQAPLAIVLPAISGQHLQVCYAEAVLKLLCCAVLCCRTLSHGALLKGSILCLLSTAGGCFDSGTITPHEDKKPCSTSTDLRTASCVYGALCSNTCLGWCTHAYAR